MIDELKLILELIVDLSGVAVWVICGFILYKFVVFSATSGAIVYLLKMAMDKLYSYLMREKIIKVRIGGHFINDEKRFMELIECSKRSTGSYIHDSDIEWLEKAIKEKNERDA